MSNPADTDTNMEDSIRYGQSDFLGHYFTLGSDTKLVIPQFSRTRMPYSAYNPKGTQANPYLVPAAMTVYKH